MKFHEVKDLECYEKVGGSERVYEFPHLETKGFYTVHNSNSLQLSPRNLAESRNNDLRLLQNPGLIDFVD